MENLKDFYKQERGQEWRVVIRKSIKTKDRTEFPRTEMPAQDPVQRSHNGLEVNLGLTPEMAMQEARRCIDCPDPTCISGCPVEILIPKFIKNIEVGKFFEAAQVLKETSCLPAVCGRVCPQEKQCEINCFYTIKLNKPPVSIGALERFAADYERENGDMNVPKVAESNGVKVASIGSGPASLSWAADMARLGYDVTVFEALHEFGGVLKYGIPDFRLPNEIVDVEIDNLKAMGVKFLKNFIVGRTATIDELRKRGFKSFFVASGAGLPRFMNIPGENLSGIFSANEYLTRINLMGASKDDYDTPIALGKNVAVIGGGNTAMDSVRTAKRLGAENAMIVYRRTRDEMPARLEEVEHALEEGINFMNLTNPVGYVGDSNGRVKKMILQKMELGEPDVSGRRRPMAVEGSEYEVEVDVVIVAVGVSPNPLIPATVSGLKTSKWGTIEVNDDFQTSIDDIFAGGDIVRGGATVILAMGDGRKAAVAMDRYLKSKIEK